jgi:hypothetical protein
MRAKEFIPASKPRNFVAKNQKTAGAGAHKDKKRAEKQGDSKHKKDLIPMEDAPVPTDKGERMVKHGSRKDMPRTVNSQTKSVVSLMPLLGKHTIRTKVNHDRNYNNSKV